MADYATPNLPSRDFAATVMFYEGLGFTTLYRDPAWLILTRGGLVLEFFPDASLDPATSSFGSCLRLDDLEAFYRECVDTGVPEAEAGFPRLQPPHWEVSGLRIGALLDPDGSLLRLIQNPE